MCPWSLGYPLYYNSGKVEGEDLGRSASGIRDITHAYYTAINTPITGRASWEGCRGLKNLQSPLSKELVYLVTRHSVF